MSDEVPGPASTEPVTATADTGSEEVVAEVTDPPLFVRPLPPADQILSMAADPANRVRAAEMIALTPGAGSELLAATGHPIEDWTVVAEEPSRTPTVVIAVLDVTSSTAAVPPDITALARVSQGNSDTAGFQVLEPSELSPAFADDPDPLQQPQIPLDWSVLGGEGRVVELAGVPVFCVLGGTAIDAPVRARVWDVDGGLALVLTLGPDDPVAGSLTREGCPTEPTTIRVVLPEGSTAEDLLDGRWVQPRPPA